MVWKAIFTLALIRLILFTIGVYSVLEGVELLLHHGNLLLIAFLWSLGVILIFFRVDINVEG